ncbi:cyclin-dependent kinase 5 activator protein [Ditylenchus destructor]|nr:cyclin-dependent kinase 5 activator protein [Ditylenchus destructor]
MGSTLSSSSIGGSSTSGSISSSLSGASSIACHNNNRTSRGGLSPNYYSQVSSCNSSRSSRLGNVPPQKSKVGRAAGREVLYTVNNARINNNNNDRDWGLYHSGQYRQNKASLLHCQTMNGNCAGDAASNGSSVGRKAGTQLLLNGWNLLTKKVGSQHTTQTNSVYFSNKKDNNNNSNFPGNYVYGSGDERQRDSWQSWKGSPEECKWSNGKSNKCGSPTADRLSSLSVKNGQRTILNEYQNGHKRIQVGIGKSKSSGQTTINGTASSGLLNIFRNGILQHSNHQKSTQSSNKPYTVFRSLDEQDGSVIANPYNKVQNGNIVGSDKITNGSRKDNNAYRLSKQDNVDNNNGSYGRPSPTAPAATTPLSPTHKPTAWLGGKFHQPGRRLPSFSSILNPSASHNNAKLSSENRKNAQTAAHHRNSLCAEDARRGNNKNGMVTSVSSHGNNGRRPHSWAVCDQTNFDVPPPPPNSVISGDSARSPTEWGYYCPSAVEAIEPPKYGISLVSGNQNNRVHNGRKYEAQTNQNGIRSGGQHKKTVIQASTSELLRGLSHFIARRCEALELKGFEPSQVVVWMRSVDRALIMQGWQDVAFINPANLVFVYMLIRDRLQSMDFSCSGSNSSDSLCIDANRENNSPYGCEDDDSCDSFKSGKSCHENGRQQKLLRKRLANVDELQSLVLTCLYISYSYMGNEISYPLKPFIAENTDRSQFWCGCVDIINAHSTDMLRLNSSSAFFLEVFSELKNYSIDC